MVPTYFSVIPTESNRQLQNPEIQLVYKELIYASIRRLLRRRSLSMATHNERAQSAVAWLVRQNIDRSLRSD